MARDEISSRTEESAVVRSLEILQRRWKVALAVTTAVLAAAVSFALYLPDLYKATAVVLVERQLPESYVRPVLSDEVDSRLHVIKQQVLSRTRLTELMNRFNLYADLRARNDMDTVLEQMRQDIDVDPTGPEQISGRIKTVAFNLTYTGTDRATVADVTNAIAAFYVAQNNRMRSEEASRAAEFLKTELAEAKAQLDRHEQAVRAFTQRNVGQLPQQVDVNLATLDRLNAQLRLNGERQLRLLEQREKLLDVPVVPPATPGAAAPTPAAVRLDQAKLELQALRARVTDNHPDVRRLKDEIDALERDPQLRAPQPAAAASASAAAPPPVARQSLRTVEGIDAELETLKRDEASLRQNVTTVERRLEGLPYRQNEYALISRDHQAAKDHYDSLLNRYEEAQLATSMETSNEGERFRVLELATAPLGPSAPNRPRLLLMGLLIAVLLAGVVVLLVEQVDSSFHSVDDVRAFTSIPVLIAIPSIGLAPSRQWARAAVAGASVIAGILLIGALAAYLARGNDQLVRMLFRV